MSLFVFLIEVVLVSLSGVMAPGPLTAVTISSGGESPHAGALAAIGHAIVELPLMLVILYGLGHLLQQPYVRVGIALVGGLLLAIMGVGMFRRMKEVEANPSDDPRSPVMAGVVLSLGNPYFLLWWATVGATLISQLVEWGMAGFFLLAAIHWLCDFGWLYLLSALSFKGGKLLGRRFQTAVSAVTGAVFLFFSARFIIGALGEILA